MNINIFLSIVIVGLSMIYFLFKPMDLEKTNNKEMPQFSLEKFTIYELNQNGLITKMTGDNALRYSDRYVINSIDYTDNSEEYKTNMKADSGLYKSDTVYLTGNVRLNRDDGLSFFSQKLTYDKIKYIAKTDVKYTAYMGQNYITGDSAIVDNKKQKVKSKHIYAVYDLERE